MHHETGALQAFEQRVARLIGAEAAVLANSGYCANVGLISGDLPSRDACVHRHESAFIAVGRRKVRRCQAHAILP